jgi:phosphoribosylformylglycinamidine synthase
MGRSVSVYTDSGTTLKDYVAEVLVSLKPGVNDPEGLAIRDGLHSLGYEEVEGVRSGKYLRLVVRAHSPELAERQVAEMCDRLLSNPVIEQYRIEVRDDMAR